MRYGLLMLICLPTCGLLRRNGAHPREMADSRVLATTRRIHIRRRVAVLRDSSHFRGFRPAVGSEASRAVHPRELGKRRMRSSLASGKSATPPARCIHRPQRDTSSAGYRLLVSRASVGASRERGLLRPLRGSAFGLGQPDRFATGAWSLAVPLRSFLACVALPRPSIRRVFLRSLCARRCPIDSLNLIRDKIAVWLISAWQFRYNMTQSRCKQGKRRKTTKWAIKRAAPKGCFPMRSNSWREPFGLSPNMHWRQ